MPEVLHLILCLHSIKQEYYVLGFLQIVFTKYLVGMLILKVLYKSHLRFKLQVIYKLFTKYHAETLML